MQRKLILFGKSLEKCPLFQGIPLDQAVDFLCCAKARLCDYKKGQIIIEQGESVSEIGIMLSGTANAVHLQIDGRQTLAAQVTPGRLFADLLAAGQHNQSPVTIAAQEDCTVCFVPWQGVMVRCGENCHKHTKVLQNLVAVFSHKFFEFFDRIECLTTNGLEEKITVLLEKHHAKSGQATFTLPYDREGMASYLGVDRSALSRKLGQMRKAGKIAYYKNKFTIL